MTRDQQKLYMRDAHIAVYLALQSGELMKTGCEECGQEPSIAHHWHYGRPLDIWWLCATHHRFWHKHNNALYPENAPILTKTPPYLLLAHLRKPGKLK